MHRCMRPARCQQPTSSGCGHESTPCIRPVVLCLITLLHAAGADMCSNPVPNLCTGCPKGCVTTRIENYTTQECCHECEAAPTCTFWTMNHGTGVCNLKNGSKQHRQGNCTSGDKPVAPTPATPAPPTPAPLPPLSCNKFENARVPNILMIIGDDFGWTDVGYHGGEIPTANMDQLAAQGVKLEQYYVLPVCTPTRSAIMSSRYPIKTGLQVSTISPAKPYGLHLNYTTLPQALRTLGYKTHGIGKWHLGYCRPEFVPTQRGFDDWHGYYNGAESYFTHIRAPDRVAFKNFSSGFDYYMDQGAVNWAEFRSKDYSTNDFAAQAKKVVDAHNESEPLFLYVAFQAVHSPYQAPDSYIDAMAKYSSRGTYAGMVFALDEAIGNITRAFIAKGDAFWANTLLVYSTDNGGIGDGRNWPLRGRKATVWEGGTRGVGFVTGCLIQSQLRGTESNQLMHAVDWLPTLLHVASHGSWSPNATATATANTTMQGVDGIDVWASISSNATSPRSEVLYNIEDGHTALRMGRYKLLHSVNASWDPRPLPAHSGEAQQGITEEQMKQKAVAAPTSNWLFDLEKDPNEHTNLYHDPKLGSVVHKLESRLAEFQAATVPALYNVMKDDARANPALHNLTWAPWGCEAD